MQQIQIKAVVIAGLPLALKGSVNIEASL